ncbi:MAG: IPT/TIG domain-containing protein, partial [Janthinobacterium lividum]
AASGTLVGTFATTTGTGTGQGPFTYTLVAGAGSTDNASFAISTGPNAGKLVTAAVFDFETKTSYTVRVRTTDATGLYYEQAFTISITNVLEVPTLTALSAAAELPGMPVVLTGTDFASGSTVSFGGVAASSVTYTSPTSLTAIVPVGAAAGSSAVVVTTTSGSSTGSPAFEVLQVYRNPAASGCLATASISLTGTGGPGVWRYLRLADAGGAVVAAIEDTYNLGTVSAGFTALGTGTSVAVRQDGSHHYYLDRNFYLTATSQTFPGKTVRVRFFGLSSELARLHAADANATAATLNASQYSGANENCELSDNAPAGSRLLAAPATVLSGADWFTAQVSVTDHFSEFYLTGANTPLPVELLTFTARKQGAAVQLDWRTASEKDADRFEVERSPDGLAFASIGTVAAKGTSLTPTDYAFADTRYPSTSRQFYYRLRQVDRDGTAAYSPVRVVTLDDQARLSLYPNPAHSALAVLGAAPGTKLDVLDAVGRVVATATTDADGTAQLTLPTGLAAGVYVVRCGAQVQRLTVE